MPEINETPSIDSEITVIENATFGEEVRQAIIDALIKCYTDVIATVMTYVKKGDSITDADINQNGELVLTITNNETQTSRTENVGTVVGSDGSDGAGIQSIRLDTTVGSSTYGHLFIQIQGQAETDIGYIIGPKGDPGETAPEHEWNVDGSFSQSSVNPVQNKVITAKLNEIMTDKLNKTDVDSVLSTTRTNPVQNKVITSALNGKLNKSSVDDTFSQSSINPVQNNVITAKLNEIIAGKIDKFSISSNHVLTSNGSGGVQDSTKLIGNSNNFHAPSSDSNYLALESAVKQYTYSKSESDNRYVQISQIDDELDEESENPVQNKVVSEKFTEFEENYSAPEAALDITSTNAVQNKVITEALNSKVNISDFDSTIFDDINLVFSNTNGGIYYGGDCPSAPALFIEAESGVSEYPSGYAYYLSYIDSLYDSDDNPHWHRIANISNLITRVIPVDNELNDTSKNPVQNKVIKVALDKKMEYVDESYGPQSLDDINHFTDPNKIYHFYLGLNNINEMVDLIFVVNDDEADWDNEVYPYSCQFMLSQSGKIYYRKTDDQGLFGNVKDFNPINDVETKLDNIYETTQNHFNVDTDIIIGKNNLGNDVNTRAITVPIYTGDNSTVVSVRKIPVNLKYKVYAYPGETFNNPTDYTASGWISTIGQDLVIDNVNKRYIRVMFGSVNDATLTASDFIGLQMQVEAGSQKTDFVSPFTAVDCVARNRSYPVHLKICSYNVGMYSYGISTDTPAANAVSNLVDFLEKNNFDIIGIQEGRRYVDGNDINENTYNDFFISQKNILNNCAIKSQFVLKETGEGTFTAGSRKYVYAIANIGNKEVFIMSVHFALNASDRSSNYTELLALLSQHEYFIVFGDFNAAIEYNTDIDEQTQAEFNNLINAGYTIANGGRWGLLNTMGTTSKHPDNICVSKNIKMISAKVADVYSTMNSDHLPIIVDIVV